MMGSPSSNPDDSLLKRFKKGDQEAANLLLGQYFDRAVRAAGKRISQRRLRGTGSEDIAASVFESLWEKVENRQFGDADLLTTDEFWRLLCTMIRFKTEDHLRRENAAKRGGGQLRGESVFCHPTGDSPGLSGQPDVQLTADEHAAFAEQHQQLMDSLGDPVLQEIVTMRLEEHPIREIAHHFDRSERWVKRKLARIRDIWAGRLDGNR